MVRYSYPPTVYRGGYRIRSSPSGLVGDLILLSYYFPSNQAMAAGESITGGGSGSLAGSGARGGGQGMPERQGGTGAADIGAGPQGVVPGSSIQRLGDASTNLLQCMHP